MLEFEGQGQTSEIQLISTLSLESPFGVKRTDKGWQLIVNKGYFLGKGFTPNEINGASYLEQERLTKQTATNTVSTVEGLRKWQEIGTQDSHIVAFQSAFERFAALSSLERRDPEKGRLARKFLEKFANRSPSQSQVDQLFGLVAKKGLGQEIDSEPSVVTTVLANLERQEQIEDRSVSPLDALFSPDLSFGAKTLWFENRFLPRLEFLKRQDQLKRGKEVPPESPRDTPSKDETPPPPPPPSQDEYEQHRGREEKGAGAPIFVVNPGYTGYWEGESYDLIDEKTGRLSKSSTQRIKTAAPSISQTFIKNSQRTINGQSGTNLFSLPLAPGFSTTQDGLTGLKSTGAQVYVDAEGHFFVDPSNNQSLSVEIALGAEAPHKGITSLDTATSEQVPDEIQVELDRIKAMTSDPLERISLWKDFIGLAFKYPQDDQVETMYSIVDQSSSRPQALVSGKQLDCYLAREFFVAGLKRLELKNVEWRLINGFYAAGKQKDGAVGLHSGNAHAWVKVRQIGDNIWFIFDPTPPGDPIHEGEGSMDEFGQSSPNLLSEDNLQQLEEQAREEESKNTAKETQDQYLMRFSREAGVSPDEAKAILDNLKEVDKMKDRKGRVILARLKEQFNRIIDYYTEFTREYRGQVEMSKGSELDDPVDAIIDVKSGSLDPMGFKKGRIIEENQEFYGGLDLEVIADGSGSMTEPLGGIVKYLQQRDMSYLLHRGLHWFSQEAQKRRLRLVTPLKIRSSQFIFRGSEIEEIKPLSDQFTPLQMASLWKRSAENIGGGTPAHLGLQAVLDRITPEEVQLLQEKKLLKVIALISDGGYDNRSMVEELIKRMQDMNIVVAQFPITSKESLEMLPENVAERVIEATRLIIPERVRR